MIIIYLHNNSSSYSCWKSEMSAARMFKTDNNTTVKCSATSTEAVNTLDDDLKLSLSTAQIEFCSEALKFLNNKRINHSELLQHEFASLPPRDKSFVLFLSLSASWFLFFFIHAVIFLQLLSFFHQIWQDLEFLGLEVDMYMIVSFTGWLIQSLTRKAIVKLMFRSPRIHQFSRERIWNSLRTSLKSSNNQLKCPNQIFQNTQIHRIRAS